MFTVHDTSRSLTVALPDKGHAIVSQAEGNVWHCTGLSFDDARRFAESLNRVADECPRATPAQIFTLWRKGRALN